MTFFIDYDKQPRRFLKNTEKHIAQRIIDKIEQTLKDNPVPHDAKTIVGHHGVFRIRIGEYRALYRINHEEKKIVIVEINKRDRIY